MIAPNQRKQYSRANADMISTVLKIASLGSSLNQVMSSLSSFMLLVVFIVRDFEIPIREIVPGFFVIEIGIGFYEDI